MSTRSLYRFLQFIFTNFSNHWNSIFIYHLIHQSFIQLYLIILFIIHNFQSHKLHLFLLSFLLRVLFYYPSCLVIRSVMDKNTRITISTSSCLVIIFTSLRIVINYCWRSYIIYGFLWSNTPEYDLRLMESWVRLN
jgi:hypothetical protein